MLQAIVFDFDGVIVDSEPLHYRALLRVAETLGFHFDYRRYVQRYIGYDDRDALRAILMDGGKSDGEIDNAQIAQLVLAKADAFEAIVAEGVGSFPGVLELIAQLSRQIPLAIASGATRRDIDLILGRLGVTGLFDPIITADQVRRSKPDPQTYALAVAGLAQRHPALALEPGQCLAIEDTPAGLESARAAGLWTLGITTNHPPALLHRAHRVVGGLEGLSLDQLRQWFA
jgi:beta-phosphoglucomutase